MAEEQLLKNAITCGEEKDPSRNSLPMMSMEDGQDLESLPPQKKSVNLVSSLLQSAEGRRYCLRKRIDCNTELQT